MERSWSRILEKYGPLAAIALFLVWWLASDVAGGVRTLNATLQEHISDTNHYLRSICVNTAKDEAQRAGCMLPMGPNR